MQKIDLTPMHFEDEDVSIPVTIGKKQYTLRPADGATSARYRNAVMRAIRFKATADKPEMTGVDGLADAEFTLVAGCLHTEEGEQVTESFVRALRSTIVKDLFARAKALSGISDKDGEEAVGK